MSATTCRYTFEQSVLDVVEMNVCLKDSSSRCSDPFIIAISFSSSSNSDLVDLALVLDALLKYLIKMATVHLLKTW